eukprot:CAMPEP_0116138662 /NCGR_PEP_ID=MMETSP0329-20121206/12898_1 /TAXON_ID=697910 /ORGANISM="Pseudo-nitzschia arenysensis, Strain B593" /LENGTH=390 /DNA_ID=CAMNT_0003633653 /DNA_START=151 /DNA_END=1324 /DNA_ORIENTATION=-
MPSLKPSRSSGRRRGNRGNNNTKGRTLLLAAVCASLSPSASAFTVGPVNGPAHAGGRTSSTPQNEASTLSSSPNDDDYFFTAPTQPHDDDDDDDDDDKATSSSDIGMVSAEQTELETMEVAIEEEEDLLSTSSILASASSIPPPAPAAFMDVDGNGTGALMKRSPAAGGVDPPLMATNPYLAFPIDSGKEGMQAQDTRERTRKPSNGGFVDSAQPKTRLVRYSLPASDALEPSQEPTEKRLVLAPPSSKDSMNSELARPKRSPMQPSKPRLVRYNGPDVEHSTDYDGMELPSVKDKRNRDLKLTRANLVRYNGASQTKQLTEEVPISSESDDENGMTGTEDDHQKDRKTLVEDLGYANRYTGLSDYNLARKTGLAVNKPISLWVERDKFL